ncbi:Protein CBG17183 [Caenorhabditis briggsae]|nr:Protein CBG17183 [Caenorhabditis briggsae]CAP34942.2 Protein CBG17183 [Caenorhabditis briggsae]
MNNYWVDPVDEYFVGDYFEFRFAGPAELRPPPEVKVPANLIPAPVDDSALKAAGPLEKDIKIEPEDPDFPPSKPPTPPPKPPAKFYLPPGRSTNVSLWTEEDLRRWVAMFLKRKEHVETFKILERLEIDGDVLQSIYENKPAHTTFGINLEDFEAIQAHAHELFKVNKKVKYEP